jgi:hypothetical protein
MQWSARTWKRQKGKGVGSFIIKAAPFIFKAIKAGAKIGTEIIDRNKHPKTSAALDIISGLGVHPVKYTRGLPQQRNHRIRRTTVRSRR